MLIPKNIRIMGQSGPRLSLPYWSADELISASINRGQATQDSGTLWQSPLLNPRAILTGLQFGPPS